MQRKAPAAVEAGLPVVSDPSGAALAGRHVLVVEDEPLLAFDYQDELADRGALPRIALTLDEAVESLAGGLPDFAILDVNLGSELVWPVAETLTSGGVPFLLVSGYAMSSRLPAGVVPVECIEKPVGAHAVAERIASIARS
jgi:DNA-binding response OmpR family regulator